MTFGVLNVPSGRGVTGSGLSPKFLFSASLILGKLDRPCIVSGGEVVIICVESSVRVIFYQHETIEDIWICG